MQDADVAASYPETPKPYEDGEIFGQESLVLRTPKGSHVMHWSMNRPG
jgi:hypothetical protein